MCGLLSYAGIQDNGLFWDVDWWLLAGKYAIATAAKKTLTPERWDEAFDYYGTTLIGLSYE